jgi:hypothetical protein
MIDDDDAREYVEHVLRTQIYHCTPVELDAVDAFRAQLDYQLWNIIKAAEARAARRK